MVQLASVFDHKLRKKKISKIGAVKDIRRRAWSVSSFLFVNPK